MTVIEYQMIPDHAQYRKDVEAISNYRLKVATENEDVRPELPSSQYSTESYCCALIL